MSCTIKVIASFVILFCIVLVACGDGKNTGQSQVTAPPTVTLQSITVTPGAPSVAAGRTLQLAASGTYSDNTSKDMTTTVTWTSSDTNIATVAGGLVTGKAPGTAKITASSGGISGSVTVTVTAAVPTALAVTPTSATVAKGASQTFAAKATMSDNTVQDVSAVATWASNNTSVATVDTHGIATTVSAGSATITATYSGLNASAALTVTPPTLAKIVVSPTGESIAKGQTLQFAANGIWSDNSTQDMTATVSWSTSDAAIATVNDAGLAASIGVGTVTVTATSGTGPTAVSGSAILTVTNAALASIDVLPDSAIVPKGANQQFTALGIYTDFSTQDLTASSAWTSDNPAVASVGANTGLALGLTEGLANITGTNGSFYETSQLTVTDAKLVSILVTPANASISTITKQQFTATGIFTDGSELDITASVTWNSDTPAVATISSLGMATPIAAGTTTIIATYNDGTTTYTGSTTLTVTGAKLVSIVVGPANQRVGIGASVQYTAVGLFDDNTAQDISSIVTWTSSNAHIAMISATGLAATTGMGTATITASFGAVSGSTTLTVTEATLQQILILPANFDVSTLSIPPVQPPLTITFHVRLQMKVVGYYTDQSFRTLTAVSWSSNKPNVAVLTGPGVIRSKWRPGTVTVTVNWNGTKGTAALTVTNAYVVSLQVTPNPAQVATGTVQPFTATATLSDGTTQDVTRSVRWTTSNYAVAIVDNAGIATGVAAGGANVMASYYNQDNSRVEGSATLTVTAAKLQSIAVVPPSPSIPLGGSLQFAAVGTFDDNTTQDLTSIAGWSSSDVSVLFMSFSNKGLAITTGAGTVTVDASVGGVHGTAPVTVTTPN